MKTNKSNTELILKLQNGDKVAFYQIYERYSKKVYGFVLRYIKHDTDAEEIVQEVFVKIWEARNRIDAYSSFDSFLFTVAYNITVNLLRKKLTEKKYFEYLKTIQEPDDTSEVENEIRFNELNEKVNQLLDQLTPRQKEIFLLSREEGLSHDEIAKKLDVSINTVKKHVSNTLAFLKSHIDTSLSANLFFVFLFL